MLWLGANVMLEYDINDAKELLSNNKGNAIKSLEDVNEQMGKFFFHNWIYLSFYQPSFAIKWPPLRCQWPVSITGMLIDERQPIWSKEEILTPLVAPRPENKTETHTQITTLF